MINIGILKSYLKRSSGKVKIVSFDVFDTLLMRLVPTERVSQLAAARLSRLLHEEGIDRLSEKMVLKSRYGFNQRAEFKGVEWTISQWLDDLAKEQDIDAAILLNFGLQAELDAEEISLRIAGNAVEALALVKKHGLSVIAISDTWIDQEWLSKLLKRFGLFFDVVFSSGTLGHSKRRGAIFRTIERRLGLNSKAFLHIGNKFLSDYLRPRMSGWKSVHVPMRHFLVRMNVPPRLRKGPLRPQAYEDIIQALEMTCTSRASNPYFRLAYDYLAPLLIIFSLVQWQRFKGQQIDKALYMARDARIILDVYDIIADLLPGSCPRYYIRLSRRSVALPHPDNLLQNATPLAGKVGRENTAQWLSNFVLGPGIHKKILKQSGLSEESGFRESERRALRQACDRLLPEIIAAQSEQRILIKDYIKQQIGDFSNKRVGIIDTGWACTTQDAIRGILDEVDIISGVYLGVSAQGRSPGPKNLKYGLLRDDFRKVCHHNPVEASAGVVRMWDTLLREATGTVLGLERKKGGKVEPLLGVSKTIGKSEQTAARLIYQGACAGTLARRKGVGLLAKTADQMDIRDFEIAATAIARRISTHPSRKTTKAILQLGFDEGTAMGAEGNLGMGALKNGVAWYPGILASMGLSCSSPVLEAAARVILSRKKRKYPADKMPCHGNES